MTTTTLKKNSSGNVIKSRCTGNPIGDCDCDCTDTVVFGGLPETVTPASLYNYYEDLSQEQTPPVPACLLWSRDEATIRGVTQDVDGNVYFLYDETGSVGHIVKLDVNGVQQWTVQPRSSLPIGNIAIDADGCIYVGYKGLGGGTPFVSGAQIRVWKLDPSNGSKIWEGEGCGTIGVVPRIAVNQHGECYICTTGHDDWEGSPGDDYSCLFQYDTDGDIAETWNGFWPSINIGAVDVAGDVAIGPNDEVFVVTDATYRNYTADPYYFDRAAIFKLTRTLSAESWFAISSSYAWGSSDYEGGLTSRITSDGAGNCYVLTVEIPAGTTPDGTKLEKFNSAGASQWEVTVGLESRTAISGYPSVPTVGMDLEHDRDGLIWVVGQAEGAAATVLKTFDEADGTAGPYSWNRPDSDQYLQAISTRRGFLVGDAP